MDKIKTKGSLTIIAAICVVISVCAGFGFLPAAQGINSMWHSMFPQLRDTNRGMWAIAEPEIQSRTRR